MRSIYFNKLFVLFCIFFFCFQFDVQAKKPKGHIRNAHATHKTNKQKKSRRICAKVKVKTRKGFRLVRRCFKPVFFARGVDSSKFRKDFLSLPSGEIAIATVEEPSKIFRVQIFDSKSISPSPHQDDTHLKPIQETDAKIDTPKDLTINLSKIELQISNVVKPHFFPSLGFSLNTSAVENLQGSMEQTVGSMQPSSGLSIEDHSQAMSNQPFGNEQKQQPSDEQRQGEPIATLQPQPSESPVSEMALIEKNNSTDAHLPPVEPEAEGETEEAPSAPLPKATSSVQAALQAKQLVQSIIRGKKPRDYPDSNWWDAENAPNAAKIDLQGREFNKESIAILEQVFRCKRSQHVRNINPQLFVLLSAVYDHFGKKPIILVSGHRLRDQRGYESSGSYHRLGSSMDIQIPGVSIQEITEFADHYLDAGKSGIGIYPNSGFVHIDLRPDTSYHWVDYSGGGGRRKRTSYARSTTKGKRPHVAISSSKGKKRSRSV